MHDTPRPHDLLWGMTPAQLPADAPAWAVAVLAAGQPGVVRQAVVHVDPRDGVLEVARRGALERDRVDDVLHADLVDRDLAAVGRGLHVGHEFFGVS